MTNRAIIRHRPIYHVGMDVGMDVGMPTMTCLCVCVHAHICASCVM